MLAGPPAAAMTYVKELMGLEPSVYGGGGSDSSPPLFEDSPLVSAGSAAFASCSTLVGAGLTSCSGGAGEKAGGGVESGSVTRALRRSGEAVGGK